MNMADKEAAQKLIAKALAAYASDIQAEKDEEPKGYLYCFLFIMFSEARSRLVKVKRKLPL